MPSTRYVWLVCGVAVLLLDTFGSLAARRWGFAYESLRPISFLLYFCAGVGAGRLAGVWAGGMAGGVTALIDATLGWAISSGVGATRSTGLTTLTLAVVALAVVFTGWVLGLIGGAIGKAVHRSVAADA